MQVLCGLQVLFLLFNCQTPVMISTRVQKQGNHFLHEGMTLCFPVPEYGVDRESVNENA